MKAIAYILLTVLTLTFVSWALAIPDKLDMLGLPFDSAWQAAKQMWNKKKGK